MTEIERLLVRVAQGVSGGRSSGTPAGSKVVDFQGSLDWRDWDRLHMVASQLENGEYKPDEATPTVESRLEALEKRLLGYEAVKDYVDGLPTIQSICESPAVNDMVRDLVRAEEGNGRDEDRIRELIQDVLTDYMQEDNGWKDYLRDLVSKAVDDVDLDSFVDTYLRDRGVERYMDPEALRHEIEAVLSEVLAGAAALAKPASKRFGARKIGGGS